MLNSEQQHTRSFLGKIKPFEDVEIVGEFD